MTLCVAQLPLLSCCCTSNILCAFYAAVKGFCAAPIPKKKTRHWRVSLNAFYYSIFIYILFNNLSEEQRDLFRVLIADLQIDLHRLFARSTYAFQPL